MDGGILSTEDIRMLLERSPRCIKGDIFENWREVANPPIPEGTFALPAFQGSGVVGNYTASAAEGRASENRFRKLCKRCLPANRYPHARTTTLFEDARQHVDVEISVLVDTEDEESIARKMCKVDVKAPKRASRHRSLVDQIMWVELRGRSGSPGWAYGQAEIVAQEIHRQGFVLFDRVALKDLAEAEARSNPAARHTRRQNPDELVVKLDMSACIQGAAIAFWK